MRVDDSIERDEFVVVQEYLRHSWRQQKRYQVNKVQTLSRKRCQEVDVGWQSQQLDVKSIDKVAR